MQDCTFPSIGASFKKWGYCTPILPKCQAHPKTSKNQNKKNPKIQRLSDYQIDMVVYGGRPLVARLSWLGALNSKMFSSSCPHIFAHVVNSCWLAPAHACPAQTSSKIFKYP
jgi:hypothetical protein